MRDFVFNKDWLERAVFTQADVVGDLLDRGEQKDQYGGMIEQK